MRAISRRTTLLTTAAMALAIAVPSAMAQDDKFPSKPIEIVTHAKYGGGTDTTARMMMIRTRRNLGVDMVVNSQQGGGGAKAISYAMGKPKDGYTILAMTQTHLYTIARGKAGVGIDDIIGIARAMDDPTFITVNAKSDIKTLEDLIARSKEKPLNWGIAEIGNTEHVGLIQFAKQTGIKYKVVPFGSGAQMVQALMSGAIDATLPNVSEASTQVIDGTFRALTVMAKTRLADFPDVPTTFEKGFEVATSTTRGYFVLKGTPQDRVEALSKAMVKAMKHSTFAEYLKSSGLDPQASVAGWQEWNENIKAEYKVAREALVELGLAK